jgi:hypothetical protein
VHQFGINLITKLISIISYDLKSSEKSFLENWFAFLSQDFNQFEEILK